MAEEPEVHPIPQLLDADVPGLQVLECSTGDDGIVNVAAAHGDGESRRDIRRRVWALIGTVAEPTASLRERREGDAVVFEVITGVPAGASQFASHGHTLRLRIRPAGAR